MTSVYHLIRALVMLLYLGHLSDKVGRKPVICACVLLSETATAVALLTKDAITFFTDRMRIPASLSPLKVVLSILLFESSDCRPVYSSAPRRKSVLSWLHSLRVP